MNLVSIYKCLCDETRLRIMNLLTVSPLCVCHIQEVLGKSQVIISQHLAYLRDRKMVVSRRHHHWMIYSLPESAPVGLELNLKCLQECVPTESVLRKDRTALKKLMGDRSVSALLDEGCCPKPSSKLAKVVPAGKARSCASR